MRIQSLFSALYGAAAGWVLVPTAAAVAASPRIIMYLTGQHPVVPSPGDVAPVTHVALAFMRSEAFVAGTRPAGGWASGFFASIPDVRAKFSPGTKLMIAIGGWGDTNGFENAARDAGSRHLWATGVADMVAELGVDGVDVDWEYPGGNGEDYKRVPNSEREWEITAYPLLLAELRRVLGPSKAISAAVPGLERDLVAFTAQTVPEITAQVDFLNVMTYDLMNRRDSVTKHHTGVRASLDSVDAYLARGAPAGQLNLGFAFYVKYFETTNCSSREGGAAATAAAAAAADPAIGCPTLLLEDPATGADLGRTGGFAWHDKVPGEVADSFAAAQARGRYDTADGSRYFWDPARALWWTYDDEQVVRAKVPRIVGARRLGGVFAWGLGEDAPEWAHYRALVDAVGCMAAGFENKDEL